MKTYLAMILLLCASLRLLELASAQVAYDPTSNTLVCSKPGGSYCPEGSLKDSTTIFCAPGSMIEVRSCNTMLSRSIPPLYIGVAVCHESSSHAGDAVCAFKGTGYSIDGEISHIPETTLCGTLESPLFALGRNCDEGGILARMQAGVAAVAVLVSETAHFKRGVDVLLPTPASLGGSVCSLPYNPWNLGECVDGAAVAVPGVPGVPVLQVVVSDGAGRQRVSSGYGVASVSSSSTTTSSVAVVPSAVSGASPSASGWPVSSSGATATGAVTVGSGGMMVCDGACWSMLLLVSLRVVAHVMLMLGRV